MKRITFVILADEDSDENRYGDDEPISMANVLEDDLLGCRVYVNVSETGDTIHGTMESFEVEDA